MIAEPIGAPDYAEAIEAWRVWRIAETKDGYRLGSVVKPTLWPPGEALAAECLRTSPLAGWLRRKRGRAHEIPDEGCECGVYAAYLPEIGRYLDEPPQRLSAARVLGQVSLWGKVVECQRGFRAARAYPLRIYVPVDSSLHRGLRWEELVAGLEVYGIPVEALPVRCSQAIQVLEQLQLASAYRP